MEQHKLFSTRINVLVNHLNYGNHLGYDSLLSILHEVRLQWLKSINPTISEINIENNIGWMVKELHVLYHSEAKHGDELNIDLFTSGQTRTSVTLEHQVENKTTGKELSSAIITLVCFNFEKAKVSKIPNTLLSALK